jgi:cell wall-associated NlpC family hydrolase
MASGFSVTLGLTGAYLLYASAKNIAPIQTLAAIIRTPANARTIINERYYPIDNGGAVLGTVTQTGTNQYSANSNANAGQSIVAFARNQIGKPYIFGGTGNPGWDCSGLTQAALNSVGVQVTHSAAQQLLSGKGKTVKASLSDLSQMQPGDLIFPDFVGDHVGIYAGNGKIIHAPKPGSTVQEIPVWAIATVKRFV